MKIYKSIYFSLFGVLILIGTTALLSYQYGTRAQANENELLSKKLEEREKMYSKSIDQIRLEKERTSSDYRSACFEFQKLYGAYEELRLNVSDNTPGIKSYSAPDSARGNEDSCYR